MPPVTLRQRRRALQRGSTFPPIGLTSALDRPGPLGCWSHADCGGYGKCVNGKCQYPIANPSQAACRTDADCNVFEMCSWGVCVEGLCLKSGQIHHRRLRPELLPVPPVSHGQEH